MRPRLHATATSEPLPPNGGANATSRESPLLLRPREAAGLLSISERKLWSLSRCGQIPCVRIGRSLRYSRDALRAWIVMQRNG